MNGSDNFAKGTLIGYSTIDSEGVISDVTDFGTVEDATDSDQQAQFDDDFFYVGGNAADDADDMIVIGGKQLNVTSDTHVLVVDSAADKEENIGIVWDKATLAQGKENADGSFEYNVWFTTSTTGGDDTDLEVLVIDNTGVFSAFDEGNNAPVGGPVQGDYDTAYAAVNVADKNVVTGAASDFNTANNNVTIELAVPAYVNAIDNAKITATKNGVTVQNLNPQFANSTVTLTVAGASTTDVIVVTVADGLVTKVNASGDATAKEFTDFKGITFAAAPAITNASANASINNANLIVNAESANGNDNYDMNGKTLNVTVTLTGATFDANDATTAVIQVSGINNSAAADNDNNATAIPAFTANGDSAVTLTVTNVEVDA